MRCPTHLHEKGAVSSQISLCTLSLQISTNGQDYTSDAVQYEVASVVLSSVTPWIGPWPHLAKPSRCGDAPTFSGSLIAATVFVAGPELGATIVTIQGARLDASDALSCRFGEAAAGSGNAGATAADGEASECRN